MSLRKFSVLGLFASLILLIAGCSIDRPLGVAFCDSNYDIQANPGNVQNLKCGISVAKNYFGIVALGDCSIDTAVKNGGITEIRYIDRSTFTFFGCSTITTKVFGLGKVATAQ